MDEPGESPQPRALRPHAAQAVLVLGTVLLVATSWWSKRRCLGSGGWQQGRQFTEYC